MVRKMWTVRSTRPISFNAWCTLCWRAYEPSRCRIKEGEAVRAWIEATTRTVSAQARAFLGAHPRVRPARRTPRGAGGPHRVAESLHGGDVRSVDRRGGDDEKRGLNASASRTRTLPPAREPAPPHPRRQGPAHRDLDRPGVHERPSGRDRGGRWIHRRGRLHLLGLECDREQRATAS